MKRINTAVERELRSDMTDKEVREARRNPPVPSELMALWGESYWLQGQWDDALVALKTKNADVEYLSRWRNAMNGKLEEVARLKRAYSGNEEILKLTQAVEGMVNAIRDGFQERIDRLLTDEWAPYERRTRKFGKAFCRSRTGASPKMLHRVGQHVFGSIEE